MNAQFYPKSPELSNYDFIKPSAKFRKVASAVIFSIILFFIFYMILIALAGAIMVGAVWAGISLIAARPGFITLVVGAGIVSLGVMFFVFLFKFVFSRTKNENPLRIEIKETEHPHFFAFIKSLNADTKTDFPKKIFVSPDVNAMVFYNSSFWSLFFPVRKNLEIGLGLVNSLTVSELKSVLAHEFGHFSQRSMKIGSYIYTVNRVIYNLVYEYDNWDNTLSGWAQTGGLFGFFAGVTFWMVERVRSLLKLAYNLMNVSYLKLSREMEYHADLIAVSVSGNESFKSALRKIEFSSFAYEYTTGYLNALTSNEKASPNLYRDHLHTLFVLAKHNDVATVNGVLEITDQDYENNLVKSRVNVKDQWASHPTLIERENNIAKVNIDAEVNGASAWTLFSKADVLQEVVTKKLYQTGFPTTSFKDLEKHEYEEYVQSEINKYKISDEFNGFYQDRYLSKFDFKSLVNSIPKLTFDQVYSNENIEMIKRLESNKVDLRILGQISLKQIPTKYFEFDNKKYKWKEANQLIQTLKVEIEKDQQLVDELDKESFVFNYSLAKKTNSEKILEDYYLSYFQLIDVFQVLDAINEKFQNFANRLYSQVRWTENEIKILAGELSTIEKEYKDFLKTQRVETLIEHVEPAAQKEVIKEYMDTNTYYAKTSDFDEQGFMNLSNLMQDIYACYGVQYGNNLKKLTDFQLELKGSLVKN